MVETVKMSSKGQVVIPQRIREEVNAGEGSIFVVLSSKDAIVLKKIEMPSKEALLKELEKMAKEGAKKAEKLGIKESDVPAMIERIRRARK